MKILVTGAAGFIGHNVVRFLEQAGHDIFGVDNRTNYGFVPADEQEYLFKERWVHLYRYAWVFFVFLGALFELEIVWNFADVMNAERKSVANELRSQGFAESETIRADAEKQRDIIITDAYREAQIIKGQGDAKASRIYAETFSKNPEFYDFYRSLEAYRKSFDGKDDIMVLDANSDFFKYLRGANKK